MSERRYSDRLEDALRFAAQLHATQIRKGTSIPYLSHLLAVCAVVLEDGGSEDEAIAALLHDAVEDQGGDPTLREIEHRYGTTVASIVLACSDTTVQPKPPWRQRKERAIEGLRTADECVLRVAAADKLHNLTATLQDLERLGDEVWLRFKEGAEGFMWYHRQILTLLEQRLPGSRTTQQLRRVMRELEERLASGEPAPTTID